MRNKTKTKITELVNGILSDRDERERKLAAHKKDQQIDRGPFWASAVDGEGNYTVCVYTVRALSRYYDPYRVRSERTITEKVVLSVGTGPSLAKALADCEKREAKRLSAERLESLTRSLNKDLA